MAHVRQQIREAAKTALSGSATCGNRVFTGRPYPLAEAHELPGIVIVSPTEKSDADTIGDVKLHRELDLVVLGYAEDAAIENVLDRIAADVETAIGNNPTFGGLAKETILNATEHSIAGTGTKRAGAVRMTFTVVYRTARAAPEIALA